MSSNRDEISDQRKDSFSDRVCDDLCQELLQWLPIKDKIKLILVSKQFKQCLQTLWLRQKCLDVNSVDCGNQMNSATELIIEDNYFFCYNLYNYNVNKLVTIFKLFPNLCQIKVQSCLFSETAKKHIFSAITKYCHKLNSFSFDFIDIDFEIIKEFSGKIGPKLQTLVTNSYDRHLSYLIERTTGLQSLEVDFSFCLFKTEDNVRRCLLKDLKHLNISEILSEDWSKLVDNNLNLTKLKIFINTFSSEESVSILRDISKLKQLKRLDIKFHDNDSYDKRLADSMALISKNCKKLVYFGFHWNCYKSFDTKNFINGFNHFSTLNEIHLMLDYTPDHLIDSIKNCKQLTKFSFESENVSKDILRQISSVFPHLKVLRLKETELKELLTDNDLKYVTQLKHLQVLSICNDDTSPISSVTDSGVLFLINNCNNLREIRIDCIITITEVTVEAMVEKAAKNPDIYFDYNFVNINNINHKIPELKNLKISLNNE